MKTLGLILLIATSSATSAFAQEQPKDSWPSWTISKDVHRTRFRNVNFTPALIKTGDSNWIVSKGVHQRKSASPVQTGTVSMKGYPTWTISKGVARHRVERESK